jgi:hypothetical protein
MKLRIVSVPAGRHIPGLLLGSRCLPCTVSVVSRGVFQSMPLSPADSRCQRRAMGGHTFKLGDNDFMTTCRLVYFSGAESPLITVVVESPVRPFARPGNHFDVKGNDLPRCP